MKTKGMQDAERRYSDCHLTRYGFRYPENPMKDDLSERVKACEVEVNRVATVDRPNGRYRIIEIKTPRERIDVQISPTGLLTVSQFKVVNGSKKT